MVRLWLFWGRSEGTSKWGVDDRFLNSINIEAGRVARSIRVLISVVEVSTKLGFKSFGDLDHRYRSRGVI